MILVQSHKRVVVKKKRKKIIKLEHPSHNFKFTNVILYKIVCQFRRIFHVHTNIIQLSDNVRDKERERERERACVHNFEHTI